MSEASDDNGVPYIPSATGAGRKLGEGDRVELLVCDAVIHAQLEMQRGAPNAEQHLAQLDSLIRQGLREFDAGDGHVHYAPIALSRMLERMGDTTAALTAIRRRNYFIGWQPFLAASLREEARLAAATGDSEGQVRALEHYLTLRANPAPVLQSATDSAKAALVRLTERRGDPGR
jgi:hypothetical protein